MLTSHKTFNPRKLSIHCDDVEIFCVHVCVPGQLNVFSVYRSPVCEVTPFKKLCYPS